MTQEQKEFLLKDLCARLPYGVILNVDNGKYREDKKLWPGLFNSDDLWDAKPYLRPMSSMTEEEREKFRIVGGVMSYNPQKDTWAISAFAPEAYDWLNFHHFDYRGLISKGLALEASEGMYR